TDQVACVIVAPLMIGTHERLALAAAVLAELHAAMRTAVLEHVEESIAIANQDDRSLADRGPLERARVGYLDLEPDVAPVRAVEDALQLALVDGGIGVNARRDPARTELVPDRSRGRIQVHSSRPIALGGCSFLARSSVQRALAFAIASDE